MLAMLSYAGQFILVIIGTLNVILITPTLNSEAKAQSLQSNAPQQADNTATNPFVIGSQLSNTEIFNQIAPGDPGLNTASIRFVALLTERGPQIYDGVVWRIFVPDTSGGNPNLIKQFTNSNPIAKLQPGTYLINAAFGLAYLTRTIHISSGDRRIEKFVINAGGLRVMIKPSIDIFSGPINATFDLLTDERDQFGNRQKIMSNVRPGRITRLNSGIYRIVSRLGDANAVVASEVTVEAGKLTEATILHKAAKVTFKLVQSAGGDALADVEWIIMSSEPDRIVIKETAGALPTHILAPGKYTIQAAWAGNIYKRAFAVQSGDNVEVEVTLK